MHIRRNSWEEGKIVTVIFFICSRIIYEKKLDAGKFVTVVLFFVCQREDKWRGKFWDEEKIVIIMFFPTDNKDLMCKESLCHIFFHYSNMLFLFGHRYIESVNTFRISPIYSNFSLARIELLNKRMPRLIKVTSVKKVECCKIRNERMAENNRWNYTYHDSMGLCYC